MDKLKYVLLENLIVFEDYHEDYLIEDCALYLVKTTSGHTVVRGIIYDDGNADFIAANDQMMFGDIPDRIAKLHVSPDVPTEKDDG